MAKSVKLSKETIDIMKNFSGVNQNLKFSEGSNTIKSRAESKTILGLANIEESFDRDVYIYDLREFINMLDLFEEPVIVPSEGDETYLTICEEKGSSKSKYYESAPNLITSEPEKDINIEDWDIVFDVERDQLEKVKNASRVMNLPYIGFRGGENGIELTTFDITEGSNNETNTFNMTIDSEPVDGEYLAYLKVENLKVMSRSYTVHIKTACIMKLIDHDNCLTYYLPLDPNSSFDLAE